MDSVKKISKHVYNHKEVIHTIYKDPDNFYNQTVYDTVDLSNMKKTSTFIDVGENYSYGNWFDFYFTMKVV